jgi:hypothetical protein
VNASTLVQKLWNYCNVLRDDGMSYGDYVEQLTYLLFLKMADERAPALQPKRPAQPGAGEVRLADAAGEKRRRTVRSLPPHARRAWASRRARWA